MNIVIIQAIGFIGLLFVVISFQKDKKSFTLISQMFAALFFGAHYFLMNAWTGAAMNILSSARAYAFNLADSRKKTDKKTIMYLFIVIFWITGIAVWQNYYSLLPVISMTLESFALWSRNTKRIRWIFLSARPTWIIYNLIIGSYAGLATETFIVISVITAIIRFDVLKKSLNNS